MADPTFGLLTDGFVPRILNDIRADVVAEIQQALGASMPVGDTDLLGIIVGIFVAKVAEVWLATQQVAASQDPNQATGAALDALCALTGTRRPQAAPSTAILTLTGVPATTIAVNSIAATPDPTDIQFGTDVATTIAALPAWVTATVYAVGDRVTNVVRAYRCITAGTSSGGPTTNAADITDGTAHWQYLGEGAGAVDVTATATVDGAQAAAAGDITVIDSAVTGWNNVTNLIAAAPGRLIAQDPELRTLRVAELAAGSSGTRDSITAALLLLTGVTAATVFVNNTDVTNSDGVPPHSIECLVQIPVGTAFDQAVLNSLLANVSAGINTYATPGPGATTGTAIDSEGVAQTYSFSRPVAVPIYVTINVTEDASVYPSDGDAEVQLAIVNYGAGLPTGSDAVATRLGAQAFKVDGVLDVPRSGSLGGCLVGIAASPTSDATIVITSRQIATYDVSRVVVHSTPGTP